MISKVKADERGRITIPGEIRESLGIGPNTELIIEKRGSTLILSKELTPEEFIKEARRFQEEIEASKFEAAEPLRMKEIWKGKPKE